MAPRLGLAMAPRSFLAIGKDAALYPRYDKPLATVYSENSRLSVEKSEIAVETLWPMH
jgi:hypothetical protein